MEEESPSLPLFPSTTGIAPKAFREHQPPGPKTTWQTLRE